LNGNENLSAHAEPIEGTDKDIKRAYKAGTINDNQNEAITNAMLQMIDEAELIYQLYHLIFANDELAKRVLDSDSVKKRMEKLVFYII
jgi:hypothetical protein